MAKNLALLVSCLKCLKHPKLIRDNKSNSNIIDKDIGTLKNMPFEHLINFMESDSDMRIRTRGYEADLWGYCGFQIIFYILPSVIY